MNPFRYLFALLPVLLLAGCYTPHEIHIAEIDERAWNAADNISVAYDNEDTVAVRSIDIICRYTDRFAYDRLVVAVNFVSPRGYSWYDTVGIRNDVLPCGSYYDKEQRYRDNVVFPEVGRYIIKFRPVMPEDNLQGISAIGVNIQ